MHSIFLCILSIRFQHIPVKERQTYGHNIWLSYCVLGQLIWPDWLLWLVLPFLSNTRNRCCHHGLAQDSFVVQDHHLMYLLTQLRNHLDLPLYTPNFSVFVKRQFRRSISNYHSLLRRDFFKNHKT